MTKPIDPTVEVDLSDEKDVQWDFKKNMSYGDYLGLNQVLEAQLCKSGHHDEMLFTLFIRCPSSGLNSSYMRLKQRLKQFSEMTWSLASKC